MALVVEDGTGKADAESYISVSDADAYHAARANTGWTGDDSVKEAALRKATAYIEARYRGSWPGTKKTKAQALAWPRSNACDAEGYEIGSSVVPSAVQHATAEAARLILEGTDLTPILERGGRVESESVKVGPIEESKTYSSSAPARTVATILDDIIGAVVTRRAGSTVLFPDRT